ncbi:MAG: phosphotransferase family protein [Dehalococcoidia bacterium]|jgi:aminoglycoside phosphotransferase (APT) family kinase protein|nr:phosphotransferase family protein [Dehalococcoidia bacterium]MDW8009739.1 phosphotransferase family protein [Chloroflexota bacterium]
MPSGETEAFPLDAIRSFLGRLFGAPVQIEDVVPLVGGAYRKAWRFEAVYEESGQARRAALVYREPPSPGTLSIPAHLEQRVMWAAKNWGVPVPSIVPLAPDRDPDAPPGIIMEFVQGESLPRRLLARASDEGWRARFVSDLAQAAARIHSLPPGELGLDELPQPAKGDGGASHQLETWERLYREQPLGERPVLELALRWLRIHRPPPQEPRLVHGDFRLGNFIVGEGGLAAVIDFEGAHLGDPMEDLGWLCLRSWRPGREGWPVAGLGSKEEFAREYERAGGAIDWGRWHYWEVMGNLKWAVFCLLQAHRALTALRSDLPTLAVGRRLAEAEWEILQLLESA